jgi:hypothetical protein
MLEGVFKATGGRYIALDSSDPQALIPAAKKTGLDWEITASPRVPKDRVGLKITLKVSGSGFPNSSLITHNSSLPPSLITHHSSLEKQAYRLSIKPTGVEITASDPAGAYYGACTLAQILRQYPNEIPCLLIGDWPDFPVRGVMLDIGRDKVPTMATLFHLVDLLSEWKINQFQLYIEHTFAYFAHPEVWKCASPMTGAEIMELDAYCRSRFIELVPNQNSFGHLERWFRHEKYRPMAEAPNGCDTVWGWREAFSLCPGDKRSIPFIRGLYDEFLPHFTSKLFNVGCDETIDLGRGRSRKVCEEKGIGRVYLDFLLKVYDLVKEQDAHKGLDYGICPERTMMFWGDIIIKHAELIPELPKDVIALEWGYEPDAPFAEHGARFAESGIPFYVAPGTSSWNTICGRTDHMLGNITNAARNGLKQGAVGLLNTDWGDNGHWQPLSVSYLGFLAGAILSWNVSSEVPLLSKEGLGEVPENSANEYFARCLSLHAFKDSTGRTGRAFYDAGNLYQVFGKRVFNSSLPWAILFRSGKDPKVLEGVTLAEIEAMEQRMLEIVESAKGDRMTCPDAEIVRLELEQIARLIRFAGIIGRARLEGTAPHDLEAEVEAVKEHQRFVWLLRNREGGLEDSLGKLDVGG